MVGRPTIQQCPGIFTYAWPSCDATPLSALRSIDTMLSSHAAARFGASLLVRGVFVVPQEHESTAVAPAKPKSRPAPLWHIVLLDDDQHTYEYVEEMLMRLFQHPQLTARRMAVEVDSTGRSIVETTTLERAELKRDQIHAYGPDPRLLERSIGSMRARLEPAE